MPPATTRAASAFIRLCCYLDETGEALAALLRSANAGANTAADHFEVLQMALEQLPAADLEREILARADVGGATHAFTHDCREAQIRFSVGYAIDERLRAAIPALPQSAWTQATDAEGEPREGAWVAELTDHLDLSAWPAGTRLVVRRERPHPGAQFEVFDQDGYRHTTFLTDQEAEIAALELRHRRRARVEDSIRTGKDTGMRNLPFGSFAANEAWLELSLTAQDLLAHSQALRAIVLKHWRRRRTIARDLVALGVKRQSAWRQVYAGRKSTWALSHTPAIDKAMPVKYFTERGLVRLVDLHRSSRRDVVAPIQPQLALEWG